MQAFHVASHRSREISSGTSSFVQHEMTPVPERGKGGIFTVEDNISIALLTGSCCFLITELPQALTIPTLSQKLFVFDHLIR